MRSQLTRFDPRRLAPVARRARTIVAISLLLVLLALAWRSAVLAQLPTVILSAPLDGTTTTVYNYTPLAIPTFKWQAVEGATKYRIQCSQDPGFASTPLNITTANPSHIPTSASAFADGTWYWRVRVESPYPPGDWSSTWSFTKQWAGPGQAPALVAPADGETLAFFDRPAFSWLRVTGAARYRFQIAASPDGFGAPELNELTLAPVFQPEDKLANGTYYWRVLPLDPADHAGTTSEVRGFVVDYDQVPELLDPPDYAQPVFTPEFCWTAVRGAEYYDLEYSTDPTFQSGVTDVTTRNTAYTPLDALPNDVNYYWRVRAQSGDSVSAWSPVRQFVKRWYFQPALLTPANLTQGVQTPLFTWTPVPGASYYKVEVSPENTFPPTYKGFTAETANTWHVQPGHDWLPEPNPEPPEWTWYWRVTTLDHEDNAGQPSPVYQFTYDPTVLVPPLVYPPFYYESQGLEPSEERAVAMPAFVWQRVLNATLLPDELVPNEQVPAYLLQVDDDPLFGSPDWTWETENLSAAPPAGAFDPASGTGYYWRVRPLDGLGGAEIGGWSQRWLARFDVDLGLAPTDGPAPQPLRPVPAAEAVETMPMLEWWPLQGAGAYEVQISSDAEAFEDHLVHTATSQYPAYTPPVRLGPGTYYWRVRGRSGGQPFGEWSAPWRFQVAAQSRWRLEPENRQLIVIGSDPAGDMADPNYDVTELYAAQSSDFWHFGFEVYTDTVDMTYALYLDLDHADGAGAGDDARGYQVGTIAAHRPEYAIYLLQEGGVLSAENTIVYRWTGSAWGIPNRLAYIGGNLYSEAGFVEIEVPNTAIGMEEETGSAAVVLWSAMEQGGHAQDTVPSDPNVDFSVPDPGPELTTLSRFSSVSDRVTLALPPSNATGDPATWPSVPPFAWHLPVDAPWRGYSIQAALDPLFTSLELDFEEYPNSYSDAFVPPLYTHADDIAGDNAYYWRVRPVYTTDPLRGAWSQSSRFEREGFVVQGLETSVTFATPTFSWLRMEGAEAYDLQVDNDPSFASPEVSANNTGQNSYTPLTTLEKGTYYWRVRAVRHKDRYPYEINNDWSPAMVFDLDLPRPVGLESDPPGVVARAPTLCWTPVLSPTVDPVLAAWKYRVEVSKDASFSEIYDWAETEQACWTPETGYGDLTGYHWHVAMLDGNDRLGGYSEAMTFDKQYPSPELLSPIGGLPIAEAPTFSWTAVDGAAEYRLEVSPYENFGTLYDSVTTDNTGYTPVKTYEPASALWWRVAMIDRDRNYGPYSTTKVSAETVSLPLIVSNH